MDTPDRRRTVVFLVPLIIAPLLIRSAAENVRTVDFVQIFACGMIVGISLVGIIRMLKSKGKATP